MRRSNETEVRDRAMRWSSGYPHGSIYIYGIPCPLSSQLDSRVHVFTYLWSVWVKHKGKLARTGIGKKCVCVACVYQCGTTEGLFSHAVSGSYAVMACLSLD